MASSCDVHGYGDLSAGDISGKCCPNVIIQLPFTYLDKIKKIVVTSLNSAAFSQVPCRIIFTKIKLLNKACKRKPEGFLSKSKHLK